MVSHDYIKYGFQHNLCHPQCVLCFLKLYFGAFAFYFGRTVQRKTGRDTVGEKRGERDQEMRYQMMYSCTTKQYSKAFNVFEISLLCLP